MKKLPIFLIFILSSIIYYFELKSKFQAGQLTSWFSLLFMPAIFAFVSGTIGLIGFILKKTTLTIQINLWILFGLLYIGEGALRQLKFYSTYLEKNKMEPYRSVYQEPEFDEFGFHRGPNSEFKVDNGEFIYERKINKWGYTGRVPQTPKPENEIRIFVLGDSFCEGAGVAFENSVPQQLERYFNDLWPSENVRFFNFGMSGSDAVFAKFLWDEKLIALQPDGVIFLQNTTDIHDIEVRGGEERFVSNTELSYKKSPSWEVYYASCHLFRAFTHRIMNYDFSLIKRSLKPQLQKEALEIIDQTYLSIIKDYSPVWVFTYPRLEEFPQKKNNYDEFEVWANQAEYNINLMPDFKNFASENNKSEEDLYWPLDRHFNLDGYTVLSNFIAKKIESNLLLIVQKNHSDSTLYQQASSN